MASPKYITKDDIIHETPFVRILHPECKKGILIYTNYKQPENAPSITETGLKTGEQLHKEGISYGRQDYYHPYIFFRAPYHSKPIDYSSIETEIISSYSSQLLNEPNKIFIRVDPNNTYVFSSEIRGKYFPKYKYGSKEYTNAVESEVNKSKKTLEKYLRIIEENKLKTFYNKTQNFYNLYSSRIIEMPIYSRFSYPIDDNDISKHSEILVDIPHLTPDCFAYYK